MPASKRRSVACPAWAPRPRPSSTSPAPARKSTPIACCGRRTCSARRGQNRSPINAQLRIGGELGEKIAAKALAQQAAMSKELGVTGKSAKEMQFAMRGLPAQITDITVGLASGQRPLMVLLQQGGQLKDMFGGIGPAAKALGSSLLGLINPFTVTAAAAGALLLAWKHGSDEAVAYNKAIITTGNYAGITAGQIGELAKSIKGSTDATQHAASAALAQVVSSGKFAGAQIENVGRAAVAMSTLT